MSQRWEDFLQVGSYKAPSGAPVEFDFVSVHDDRPRRLDVQEFDGRPGAFVADRGSGPRRFDVLAVFVYDAYDDPHHPPNNDYPERMNALIAAIDAGGVGDFVHPVFGRIKAAVERSPVNHDANEADCATMQITFVEHIDDAPLAAKVPSVPALASEVRANADVVASSGINLQRLFEDIEEAANILASIPDAAQAAANATAALANDLETNGDTYSADVIAVMVNAQLAACAAVLASNDDYQWQEQYELSQGVAAMADSLRRFMEALIERRPPLVWWTVEVDTPLLAWVFATYGDPNRVDEVLALNSIPDPVLLPAGMSLRAYAV